MLSKKESSVDLEVKENMGKENLKKFMEETREYLLHSPEASNELIAAGAGSEKAKENVLLKARSLLEGRKLEVKQIEIVLNELKKFLWGYYILEELLADDDVSDIRCMSFDSIAACINGIYEPTDLKFESREEYNSFLQLVAVANQISLADINALQYVTDKRNPDWILRIAIATAYVNSEDTYFMHIRKHPKKKRSIQELVNKGMIPKSQVEYIKKAIKGGILVAGATGAGKTHFMNACLDLIPPMTTGICMQESEELFASDPNSLFLFLHVVTKKGEGKIQYTLEDESKFGLLTSNKYFILGEIKGDEAAYFANASYTGSVCWGSVHSESSIEAPDKLCDYIMRATGYDRSFVLKMLKSLKTIVFLKDYKITEITEVEGYEEGELKYKRIYEKEVS